MTISSSLNASVTGLNVNASRLATISDNIANSGTYGYKQSVTDFHSLVVAQTSGTYSAGGVRASTTRYVDQQGTQVSTTNATDIAINGRGMVPVLPLTDVQNGIGASALQMTSTGSFRADKDGLLTTPTGDVLLGWPADRNGDIPTFPRDSISGLEAIRLADTQFEGDPTTDITLGVNLPATSTEAGSDGASFDLPVQYFGNLGQSENLNITFTPTVPATGSSNEWTMTITDDAQAGATVGEFTVTFDDTRANGGTMSSVTPLSAGTYNSVSGKITIAAQSGGIDIDIGVPLQPGGLSQLSESFAPLEIGKNGSPVGNLETVEVDSAGLLHAIYDTGFSKVLYQIPVVDVPNPNGLTGLSNQTYTVSGESGSYYLWNAGDGPVGEMVGFTREESTTDIAAELTQLIRTQRAYNSNAKVVQTVDEMLQETTNIKR